MLAPCEPPQPLKSKQQRWTPIAITPSTYARPKLDKLYTLKSTTIHRMKINNANTFCHYCSRNVKTCLKWLIFFVRNLKIFSLVKRSYGRPFIKWNIPRSIREYFNLGGWTNWLQVCSMKFIFLNIIILLCLQPKCRTFTSSGQNKAFEMHVKIVDSLFLLNLRSFSRQSFMITKAILIERYWFVCLVNCLFIKEFKTTFEVKCCVKIKILFGDVQIIIIHKFESLMSYS